MAEQSWTHDEFFAKLQELERELKNADLRESSVRTYIDWTSIFLRWLVGDCTLRGPVS